MTGVLVEDHAKVIQRVEKWYFYHDDGSIVCNSFGIPKANPARERIERYIADHDAEDRATLSRNGIGTWQAYKAVTLGIEAVQSRMKVVGDQPMLLFMRDVLVETDQELANTYKPKCTVEEVESYVWQPVKEEKETKEAPIKLHDHGMDCMRYVVCYVDNIGVEIQQEQHVLDFGGDYEISEY